MLTLRVNLDDVGEPWALSGRIASVGGSRIEAFCSPHLDISVATYASDRVVWIGEDSDPCDHSCLPTPSIERYSSFIEFEGIAVFLSAGEGSPRLSLVRTAAGCCPIYVSAYDGVITASWRFEDAALARPTRRADIDACRILLDHGPSQSRDTIIAGVHMLWPGEIATFGQDGLAFRPMDEPNVVMPSSLSDHARATDEFMRRMEHVLRPRIKRSASTILELSGGLDSSCVAIAAAGVGGGLNSYALVHDGAMGLQQRARREELISLLGLNDVTHPSGEPGPLASLQSADLSLTPHDDIYRMACVAGVLAHPNADIDLLITGIGGDELSGDDTFFRYDWEVRGLSARSSITAAASRCDMFMRMGIWVVHPMVHPLVVDFCRALPHVIRADRRLHHLTLARAGLSDGFIFPRFQEHYGNLIQFEAARFDFEKALDGTILADLGVRDYSALLIKAYEAGYGGFSYSLIHELFDYLKLDAVLKRYLT